MKKNNKLSSKVVTFLGFGGPSVILFSCVVLLPFIDGMESQAKYHVSDLKIIQDCFRIKSSGFLLEKQSFMH